jgi:hypothetical protein
MKGCVCAHKGKGHVKMNARENSHLQAMGEASEETQPARTFPYSFKLPELLKQTFILFNHPVDNILL